MIARWFVINVSLLLMQRGSGGPPRSQLIASAAQRDG